MIGSVPVLNLAPLEYRYALDAAAVLLAGQPPSVIVGSLVCLNAEVHGADRVSLVLPVLADVPSGQPATGGRRLRDRIMGAAVPATPR